MPLDKKTLLDAIKEAKAKSGQKKFNQTIELILDIKEIDMKAPEGKIRHCLTPQQNQTKSASSPLAN